MLHQRTMQLLLLLVSCWTCLGNVEYVASAEDFVTAVQAKSEHIVVTKAIQLHHTDLQPFYDEFYYFNDTRSITGECDSVYTQSQQCEVQLTFASLIIHVPDGQTFWMSNLHIRFKESSTDWRYGVAFFGSDSEKNFRTPGRVYLTDVTLESDIEDQDEQTGDNNSTSSETGAMYTSFVNIAAGGFRVVGFGPTRYTISLSVGWFAFIDSTFRDNRILPHGDDLDSVIAAEWDRSAIRLENCEFTGNGVYNSSAGVLNIVGYYETDRFWIFSDQDSARPESNVQLPEQLDAPDSKYVTYPDAEGLDDVPPQITFLTFNDDEYRNIFAEVRSSPAPSPDQIPAPGPDGTPVLGPIQAPEQPSDAEVLSMFITSAAGLCIAAVLVAVIML